MLDKREDSILLRFNIQSTNLAISATAAEEHRLMGRYFAIILGSRVSEQSVMEAVEKTANRWQSDGRPGFQFNQVMTSVPRSALVSHVLKIGQL